MQITSSITPVIPGAQVTEETVTPEAVTEQTATAETVTEAPKVETSQGFDIIGNLPIEINHLIFGSLLSCKHLGIAAQVSKTWKAMAYHNTFWSEIYKLPEDAGTENIREWIAANTVNTFKEIGERLHKLVKDIPKHSEASLVVSTLPPFPKAVLAAKFGYGFLPSSGEYGEENRKWLEEHKISIRYERDIIFTPFQASGHSESLKLSLLALIAREEERNKSMMGYFNGWAGNSIDSRIGTHRSACTDSMIETTQAQITTVINKTKAAKEFKLLTDIMDKRLIEIGGTPGEDFPEENDDFPEEKKKEKKRPCVVS